MPKHQEPPLAAATQARRLAVVSSFYELACECELREANPMQRVGRPEIDNEDVRSGLLGARRRAAARAAERWPTEAEGTVVALLLLCGFRVSEAVAIAGEDITTEGEALRVRIRRKGKHAMRATSRAP